MTKTTNYHLNQWVKSDRILMDDFNADNAKLDAAIKAEETARIAAVSAEANARQSAVNSRSQIAAGSYTGSGGTNVSVSCGFRPRLFCVGSQLGSDCMYLAPYAGGFGQGFQLYLEGVPSIRTNVGGSTSGKTTFTPSGGGISWTNSCSDTAYKSRMAMNENGMRYYWVALG